MFQSALRKKAIWSGVVDLEVSVNGRAAVEAQPRARSSFMLNFVHSLAT